MKISETLKEIYPKVNSLLGEIDSEIKESIRKIKKDYINNLIEEKIKLLKMICEGEKLNFNSMKNKYLNDKEKKLSKDSIDTQEIINEDLLDTIQINGITYFYENKEQGIIYDSESKKVGTVKNGVHILFV